MSWRPLLRSVGSVRTLAAVTLMTPLIAAPVPVHAASNSSVSGEDGEPPSTYPLVSAGQTFVEVEISFDRQSLVQAADLQRPTTGLNDVQVGSSRFDDESARLAEEARLKAEAEEAARLKAAAEQAKRIVKRTVNYSGADQLVTSGYSKDDVIAYTHAQIVEKWGEGEWSYFADLVGRESGWNHSARNSSTGAYGLGQALPAGKMASFGSDYMTNPLTQIRWMISYVSDRYGTPSRAIDFHNKHHWY